MLRGEFDPDTGARVFKALDDEIAALVQQGGDRGADRGRLAADALAGLVSGGHQAERPGVAELSLIVDERTLAGDVHEHTVCELADGTSVAIESAQRVACNAHIVPIVVDASGKVLDLGRTQRLASTRQRIALRAMYRTCAFPGCDVPFARCEIHHLTEWQQGGRTDLADLLPTCSRHHHVVHEGGWMLELDDDRTLTVTQPDGEVFAIAGFDTRRRRTDDQIDQALAS